MNEARSIQTTKWYMLLAVAAGSVLTGIIAALDRGRGPLDGASPAIGLLLLAWAVLGAVTGAWIVLAHSWRQIAREPRLRLASAYFVVGWGALFGMSIRTPVMSTLIIALGLAVAIVFLAYGLESRWRRQDKGDIFP